MAHTKDLLIYLFFFLTRGDGRGGELEDAESLRILPVHQRGGAAVPGADSVHNNVWCAGCVRAWDSCGATASGG